MKIAVACGGTGGHVYPGLATAQELARRGHEVTLWLTGRATERAARESWGGGGVEVPARGLPSGVSWESVQAGWHLLRAVRRCRQIMREEPPDVLLAMGSYASVGPCGAARGLGVPLVLHEANVIPGKAVRLFARRATAVAAAFEETRFHLSRARLEVVGLPLREELTKKAASLPPRERGAGGEFRLLVTGGSLGARRLNDVMVATLERMKRGGEKIRTVHLTGTAEEAAVREKYAAAGVEAEVIGFTEDMAPLYYAADLAICRAGASTCGELAYFGLPALFVPYPLAAGDHQMANARALEKRGTADVIEESALTEDWLEAYLRNMAAMPERLERMREAAGRRGVQDGTKALASLVESCARAT